MMFVYAVNKGENFLASFCLLLLGRLLRKVRKFSHGDPSGSPMQGTTSSLHGRLHRELALLPQIKTENPLFSSLVITQNPENFGVWNVEFEGPEASLYSNRLFSLAIHFTADYPFEAPSIRFTCTVNHVNVDERGNICLGLLKKVPELQC